MEKTKQTFWPTQYFPPPVFQAWLCGCSVLSFESTLAIPPHLPKFHLTAQVQDHSPTVGDLLDSGQQYFKVNPRKFLQPLLQSMDRQSYFLCLIVIIYFLCILHFK